MTTTDHPATALRDGATVYVLNERGTNLWWANVQSVDLDKAGQEEIAESIRQALAPSPAATGSGEWVPDVDLVGALYRCVGSATLPAEGHASAYHLGTMLNRMLAFTSERKFNRWVGYIQGVLVATGNGTVDQFKDMNRDRPDAQKAAPAVSTDARVRGLEAERDHLSGALLSVQENRDAIEASLRAIISGLRAELVALRAGGK